jgi:hypothetical protein
VARLDEAGHQQVRDTLLRWWHNRQLPDVMPGLPGFYAPDESQPVAYHAYTGSPVVTRDLPPAYRGRGFVWLALPDGHTIMASHHEFIQQ